MDRERLKTISEETIKAIVNLDNANFIITPEIYKKVFNEICESKNIDTSNLDNNLEIQEMIKESITEINNFFKSTKDKFFKLQKITDQVDIALKKRDNKAIAKLQSEIKTLKEELNSLEGKIYQDKLTKSYNKQWLIEKKLDKNLKFLKDGSFALVNIDRFENINLKFGYESIEKILIYMVKELRKYYSEISKFERDEFILFFDEDDINSMGYFLSRFRDKLYLKSFYTQGKMFNISISYGIIDFKEGECFQDKLDEVDLLMQEYRKRNEKQNAK